MTKKEKACEQFGVRRRLAQQIEKIENSDLPAGSPMYFFCRHCGIPTEILPEDFVFSPTLECSQCKGLMAEGWLEAAVGMVGSQRKVDVTRRFGEVLT